MARMPTVLLSCMAGGWVGGWAASAGLLCVLAERVCVCCVDAAREHGNGAAGGRCGIANCGAPMPSSHTHTRTHTSSRQHPHQLLAEVVPELPHQVNEAEESVCLRSS